MKGDQRRSANYHPSIWEPELIESFNSTYTCESHATQLEGLKQDVKKSLLSISDPGVLLKHVDSLQKLEIAYHFEEEINEALNLIHSEQPEDLYTTSLQFRLLREHNFPVSLAVFNKFIGRDGKFMDSLSEDVTGLLSLYEASHMRRNGEDILEEACDFSVTKLKTLVGRLESDLAEQVQLSLRTPFRWRVPRVLTKKSIEIYQKNVTENLNLLELARLDFNSVQCLYQEELKELSRWWRMLGFKEKLSFARDRLMENYLWALGIVFEPHHSKCRIGLTKFVCILTAIDDMYDVYGSLDELEIFTGAVKRWDLKAMEDLPEYMKLCYYATYNFANELAYDVLKDHGLDTLPYFKEAWTNLCGAYQVEAKWFYSSQTPSMDEYLKNAWISVGGPAAVTHAYLLQGEGFPITKKSLDCLKDGSELIYWSSLITRLSDDLGTSIAESKRGDVAKSTDCYMIERGMSREEAEEQIKDLISQSWKMLNEESAKSYLPKSMVKICLNMARTAQCIFQYGDGIGTSTGVTKDLLTSLILKPIPH
ncbi:terpene synthase 9 [Tripterygium wilfordii]|uniref:Terpene synthase 9 n=2 Tax=Tripterygium wilfordii TaxID=458696 RepID=A0A7J7DIH3_TRIWF|nr:probable terpene synthase 9 isoform X2 [Tripterygium wilfordii]AVI04915.1 terpene synthase [Tripterygium wilfordii]KAF5746034.1 terpene synthase 9 [Tripterygium wilfordii]